MATTIYEVRNKVFSILFWTEEDAQMFVNQNSPSSGFQIYSVQVFGKKIS